MRRLDGKIALITGGGSGIGRASCLAFPRAGAAVAVVGRNLARVEQVAQAIRAAGGQALALSGDMSRSEDVQACIQATVQQFGGLDILFNNAGVSPSGSVTAISEAEWDACLAINLRSVFLGAKYAVPELQRRGGGVILNTAGTFGLRAAPAKAAYAAAKAGVINLTRAIALDYAHDNIRCNAICPGYVNTPLNEGVPLAERDAFLACTQPLRGVIGPDEVAELALYLASDAARMITGQCFVIDGGQQAGMIG
ncbi:MAG: SDR family oxidoreductase [Chloroflexi bacterium]|nr:SDR family oxidoreductase [Chloroflexota bacterium]